MKRRGGREKGKGRESRRGRELDALRIITFNPDPSRNSSYKGSRRKFVQKVLIWLAMDASV